MSQPKMPTDQTIIIQEIMALKAKCAAKGYDGEGLGGWDGFVLRMQTEQPEALALLERVIGNHVQH